MEERCMRIIRIQLHEKKMKVQHEIVNGLEGIQLGAPTINRLINTKKSSGRAFHSLMVNVEIFWLVGRVVCLLGLGYGNKFYSRSLDERFADKELVTGRLLSP